MVRGTFLAFVLAFWPLIGVPGLAADRALLVSNPGTLPEADRDAAAEAHAALAALYRVKGYAVTAGMDVDRDGFAALLADFEAGLETDAAADGRLVLHFVGGAVSVGEATGLVPLGAGIGNRTTAIVETVPLALLMQIAATRPGAAMVALGIPPGPPPESAGFANAGHVFDIPDGVLVLRGQPENVRKVVADDLLGGALPVARINDTENGVRFEGTVRPDFTLAEPAPEPSEPPSAEAPAPAPASGAASGPAVDLVEEALWSLVQRNDSPAVAEAYLQRFPDGRYAAEVRRRLGLAAPVEDPAAAEAALGLDRPKRMQIQDNLTTLGYSTRGVDGVFGRGTRSAIADWQSANGLTANGFLTGEQVIALIDQVEAQAAARAAEAAAAEDRARAARQEAEIAFWEETGATGTEDGLTRYLERYPEGLYATDASDALAAIADDAAFESIAREDAAWAVAEELNSAAGYRAFLDVHPDGSRAEEALKRISALTAAAIDTGKVLEYRDAERALGLNVGSVAVLEKRLESLGYDVGPVDGQIDRSTRDAIADFQRRQDLAVSGYLDPTTIQRLILETSG